METEEIIVAKKEVRDGSYIQKVLTLTQLKRLATRELTAVFDPAIKLSKVENIFQMENFKTLEEYTKEIMDSIMCYIDTAKVVPKLVLDSLDDGMLLISGKLRMEYEYGRVFTQTDCYLRSKFDRR